MAKLALGIAAPAALLREVVKVAWRINLLNVLPFANSFAPLASTAFLTFFSFTFAFLSSFPIRTWQGIVTTGS